MLMPLGTNHEGMQRALPIALLQVTDGLTIETHLGPPHHFRPRDVRLSVASVGSLAGWL